MKRRRDEDRKMKRRKKNKKVLKVNPLVGGELSDNPPQPLVLRL